jgi:16S rRNA processing protein RimM
MGAFGVRGEVRVWLHHPESDLLATPREVVLVAPDGSRRRARLQVRPGAGRRILGRLDGLTDPETAATLRDWRVAVPRSALPALAEDELWVGELEGAKVRVEGEDVGVVTAVQHTAGPDVLVIDDGRDVHLVPLLKAFFLGFDRVARVVALAPGALAEEE